MTEHDAERGDAIVGLGARVHLFVRPDKRESFTALFRDVLGCDVIERDFGMAWPILLVRFGDGSAFSVELTELAPQEAPNESLDDARALRGAWIEFRTRNRDLVEEKLRRAGVPHFRHPGSTHTYFSAPGGQVFRILDVAYGGSMSDKIDREWQHTAQRAHWRNEVRRGIFQSPRISSPARAAQFPADNHGASGDAQERGDGPQRQSRSRQPKLA